MEVYRLRNTPHVKREGSGVHTPLSHVNVANCSLITFHPNPSSHFTDAVSHLSVASVGSKDALSMVNGAQVAGNKIHLIPF